MAGAIDTTKVESGCWDQARQMEACGQVGGLVGQVAGRPVTMRDDNLGFVLREAENETAKGIVSGMCRLVDEGVLQLTLEIARVPPGIRVAPDEIFGALGNIGPQAGLSAERDETTGVCSLQVELLVRAEPMSLARSNAVVGQLSELDSVARAVQSELPVAQSDADTKAAYEPLAKYLAAVLPLRIDADADDEALTAACDWAIETVDFLLGGSSVAVVADEAVVQDVALGLLAGVCSTHGSTIGRVRTPSISSENVLELNRKAPGTLVVPAHSLSVGTSMYELSDVAASLFAALRADKPVVFVGSFDRLQGVLSGGQGGANDPLAPVVRPVPALPTDLLVRSCVRDAGHKAGGLADAEETELIQGVTEALSDCSASDRLKALPMLAERALRAKRDGAALSHDAAVGYAARIGGLRTTLGGLAERPATGRSDEVARRYTAALTDSGLLSHLREHLVGQDAALATLVRLLRTEALTRPGHQPLRWCSQGLPATGKSMSCGLLARRLGVDHIVIDAASMSSPHAAIAQLLGSTVGVVGSYRAGRLEQAANTGAGALLEISDIDHASPDVRSALADVFLTVLETGTAQSSKGHVFSCSRLVLAFTMNLPKGRDEQVLTGLGYDSAPSWDEVQHRVSKEIKDMASGAFLSRVGHPVVFQPLSNEALATVLERAISGAVQTAAERMGYDVDEVAIPSGLGATVLRSTDTDMAAFGARGLLERGRHLAVEAILNLCQSGVDLAGRRLVVAAADSGELVIEPV